MRPILYICGPYSGPDCKAVTNNIMAARAHAIEAWRRGWTVFCPHLNTAHFERCIPEIEHTAWVNADLDIISRLDPDAILLLPGWYNSQGALREHSLAQEMDIKILGPVERPEDVPPAPKLCPAYRQVHYETDSRDTCGSLDCRCPPNKMCPIRRRCR